MPKPRFTDNERYPRPYVPSSEMPEGYLKAKFEAIRQEQEKDAKERAVKVSQIKRAK
jgi:hypothetical protein